MLFMKGWYYSACVHSFITEFEILLFFEMLHFFVEHSYSTKKKNAAFKFYSSSIHCVLYCMFYQVLYFLSIFTSFEIVFFYFLSNFSLLSQAITKEYIFRRF